LEQHSNPCASLIRSLVMVVMASNCCGQQVERHLEVFFACGIMQEVSNDV
jgi:hypothetical protein